MHEWIGHLRRIRDSGARAVVVTVAGVRGSAPREVGAKMLVSRRDTLGTIGGGQLEYQCTEIACGLLREEDVNAASLRRFPLGVNCGQCCGGVVDVLFEDFAAGSGWFDELLRIFDSGQAAVMITRLGGGQDISKEIASVDRLHSGGKLDEATIAAANKALVDRNARLHKPGAGHSLLIEPVSDPGFDIAVFGAGHVANATVAMLATLDCNIRWIDSRRNILPDKVPANVQIIRTDSPQREVAAMPANTFFLAMTHSHALDYEICCEVLNRGDFAYCGLIGSLTKRRRFSKKMDLDNVRNIDRLTCPIGVSGIGGKKPAEIAISVAAELLRISASARQEVAAGLGDNVHYMERRK